MVYIYTSRTNNGSYTSRTKNGSVSSKVGHVRKQLATLTPVAGFNDEQLVLDQIENLNITHSHR